ncbi:MAG: flagellar hook-basal body complex protein FliE [Nitrospinota bacterium]
MGNDSIINELLRMRVQAAQGAAQQKPGRPETEKTGKDFSDILKEAVAEVDSLQKEAAQAIEKLVVGEGESIHEAMIAMEKANLSFRMLMQVRNKVLAAYREVMRMQV